MNDISLLSIRKTAYTIDFLVGKKNRRTLLDPFASCSVNRSVHKKDSFPVKSVSCITHSSCTLTVFWLSVIVEVEETAQF